MREIKCLECGTVFENTNKECPNCGCPVTEQVEQIVTVNASAKKKNIFSYISLLLGIVIIILGLFVVNKKSELEPFQATRYDVSSAAFGADFYTEIYGATDKIADILNDTNEGIEVVSNTASEVINAVYFSAGMIIISLGLGVTASSFNHIKKNFFLE